MNDSYSRTSNHLFFDFNDKEEVKDAIEVSSYVLKDLINGDSIKAILGYIDKTEGTDMLPIVPQPALYEG